MFVERDRARGSRRSARNLDAVGAEATVSPARRAALPRRARDGPFDLVFCDPPYDSAARLAAPLSERLPAVLSDDARIVTESDKRTPLELPLPLVPSASTATPGSRSMAAERNGGTAVCPGSYDPITFGHLDIIGRAANVFDSVVVGVVNQPVRKQKTLFDAEERVGFIEARGRGIRQCAGKTL